MFERFTDRARRVVVLAQEEARMLDHGYIGTEHLLLGLIHEGEGVAAKALEAMGINLDAVRQQVETIIGRGKEQFRAHPVHATGEAGPGTVAARVRPARPPLHRHRAHPARADPRGAGRRRPGAGEAGRGPQPGAAAGDPVAARPRRGGGGQGARALAGAGHARRAIDDVLARIDSLDQRLAAVERWVGMGPDVRDLDQDLAQLRQDKESAIDAQDFETAASCATRRSGCSRTRPGRKRSGRRAPGTVRPWPRTSPGSARNWGGCAPCSATTASNQATAPPRNPPCREAPLLPGRSRPP